MRKVIGGLIVLLIVGCVFAQDANVITLSADDVNTAKSLWDKKQAADAAWDKFSNQIHDKYTTATEGEDYGNYNGHHYKSGWGPGISFSKDFKAIVPKQDGSLQYSSGGTTIWPCTPQFQIRPVSN